MIGALAAWYGMIQLIGLLALPLTLRLFGSLPDRGYAFAKMAGIVLVGVTFWLGYSYGLLRNEVGGAWLALVVVALVSYGVGRGALRAFWDEVRRGGNWRVIWTVEALFLVAYVLWAMVRAYDPAANHTEQPMDLMFMNSIWASATFPPQDAWFAGYPVSYYYMGYWLLTTLGRLAGQPPEIAYNVGQASWFGLLLVGCFGVVTNMLAYGYDRPLPAREDGGGARPIVPISAASMAGGVLGAVAVGVVGNLMVGLEWLYAKGMDLTRVAAWVDVAGFPERAAQTGLWYIGTDWWWWRSSRVVEDLNLLGEHIEVIDEFPIFSYVLGDNHPHVLAMPVILVVIGLALNLLLSFAEGDRIEAGLRAVMPLGRAGIALMSLITGSLVALNTWDFPPYWALLVGTCAVGGWLARDRLRVWWQPALWLGVGLIVGTLVIYLPYFLTAQSQAGGIAPNLFNPTRLPQFLLMFGPFVSGVITLVLIAHRAGSLNLRKAGIIGSAVLGLPILFLVVMGLLAVGTEAGLQRLRGTALPEGATSYVPFMWERWGRQFWTFLLVGIGLTATLTVLAETLSRRAALSRRTPATVFALLIATLGLALVYAPEFMFLVDNFGTRMNTVFKFYYQGWLLLGLATAYGVAAAWRDAERDRVAARLFATLALLFLAVGMLFPVVAVYAKTGGFGSPSPTFDATAYIGPDEQAALAWVREHTPQQSRILEGKGASYWATYNRISTVTGRPTLLGWDGHESQWRGRAYGEMAAGRPEVLFTVYRGGTPDQIRAALAAWDIDYVYVGPTEIEQYGMDAGRLRVLAETLDLVLEQGQARIYRRR